MPVRLFSVHSSSLDVISDPNMGSVAQFPGTIVSIFIQVFNNKWKLKEAWQEAWLGFQMTILHVLGAMLCSSVVRVMIITMRQCTLEWILLSNSW